MEKKFLRFVRRDNETNDEREGEGRTSEMKEKERGRKRIKKKKGEIDRCSLFDFRDLHQVTMHERVFISWLVEQKTKERLKNP